MEGPNRGPTLVLLHGTARDWNSFSSLLPDLSSRFHVFLPDLRGHGGSGRVAKGYRAEQFADDIEELIRSRVPGKAALFGHSLGGVVAMTIAARYGASAVIVGDSMLSPEHLAESLYHSIFRQLRDLIVTGGSQEELASGIGRIQLKLPGINELVAIEELPGNNPAVLREWARSAWCTDPDVLTMAIEGTTYARWSAQATLKQITCPLLLLQANPDLDGLLRDADVAFARKILPGVEHIKFPLLGHGLFMQRPEPVLNAISGFLGRHAVASR